MREVSEITYSQILPIWKYFLWPGRQDIEYSSAMLYLNKDNYSLENFKLPVFYFGIFNESNIIGVNSGHVCIDNSFRSRGLWVNPNYRRQGLGVTLLNATLDKGKELNCAFCWSLPRKTSWPAYEKSGFILTSEWSASDTSEANAYCIFNYT